jgi:hypothetical protein
MPDFDWMPGYAKETPLLGQMAVAAVTPPETFIQPIVFPDTEVPDMDFRAPVYNDDNLVAVEDDTIGRDTRMLESLLSVGSYSAELGMHGRMAQIPQVDFDRAVRAKRVAQAMGRGGDPVFDLKLMHSTSMYAKNLRHNELLACLLLKDPANYDASHKRVAGDAVNVQTSTIVREILAGASNTVSDDGNGNAANVVIVGVGAKRALEANTAFLDLLPENATKVLTREELTRILSLPDGSSVIFASARVKDKEGGDAYPIIDNWIWVGRVVPATDAVNATFGRNFWTPDTRNNRRVYTNEIKEGIQETTKLGLFNTYRPMVTGKSYGYLIETVPYAA